MMFYVVVVYIKVVDNLLILFVLKFHDFRPTSLEVIGFASLLSGFACALYSSERLGYLTNITFESPFDDNYRVVVFLLSFPKC